LSSVCRRQLIRNGVIALSTSGSAIIMPSDRALAARGAAELDFEYYVRDLVGGNPREGNVLPSKAPPAPPPRELLDPVRSLLLNNACSSDCLSTLALVETVLRVPGEDSKYIERDIQRRVNAYRQKAGKRFYARAPCRCMHERRHSGGERAGWKSVILLLLVKRRRVIRQAGGATACCRDI